MAEKKESSKKLDLTWEEYKEMRQRRTLDDLATLIVRLDEYFADQIEAYRPTT